MFVDQKQTQRNIDNQSHQKGGNSLKTCAYLRQIFEWKVKFYHSDSEKLRFFLYSNSLFKSLRYKP